MSRETREDLEWFEGRSTSLPCSGGEVVGGGSGVGEGTRGEYGDGDEIESDDHGTEETSDGVSGDDCEAFSTVDL